MTRAYIIAVVILGVLVRIGCGQATPAAGVRAGQETATPVVVETETAAEPAVTAPEPIPEAVASAGATVPQPTPTLLATETPRPLQSSTPAPAQVLTASPTHTPRSTPVTLRGVVTRRAMNVRAGPGTDFPILTMIFQDQEVSVLGKTQDESWILILTPEGKQGWAWREYIDVESSLGQVGVSRVVVVTPTSAPPQ